MLISTDNLHLKLISNNSFQAQSNNCRIQLFSLEYKMLKIDKLTNDCIYQINKTYFKGVMTISHLWITLSAGKIIFIQNEMISAIYNTD